MRPGLEKSRGRETVAFDDPVTILHVTIWGNLPGSRRRENVYEVALQYLAALWGFLRSLSVFMAILAIIYGIQIAASD